MDENLLNDLSEVEMPSLTLEMAPAAEEKPEAPKASAPITVEETPLSAAEKKMVQDFAQQIDIRDRKSVV